MSRRRRQAPLTWDEWRVRAQLAALDLLAASGCGESLVDGDLVHVHVVVTCDDPDCPECGAVRGGPRAGRLRPAGCPDAPHPGNRVAHVTAGG